jgi:hypothetical protein
MSKLMISRTEEAQQDVLERSNAGNSAHMQILQFAPFQLKMKAYTKKGIHDVSEGFKQ